MTALDVATLKRDFPILERKVNGKRLVYLDSASSAQKPLAVLARWTTRTAARANIHRGGTRSPKSDRRRSNARRKVARFVNASRRRSSSPTH